MAKSASKKSAKAAAKPVKGQRKKKGERAKPTPEALSDQQRQALLFNHKRKLKPLLEA